MRNKRPGVFTKRALTNLAVVSVGILLFMALSNFSAVLATLGWLYAIVSPFVAGLALAYVLNMPTSFFERRVFKNLKRKRGWSILAAYTAALLLVVLLLGLVLPQLFASVEHLIRSLPMYMDNLNALLYGLGEWLPFSFEEAGGLQINYDELLASFLDWGKTMLPSLLNMSGRIISGVVSALTAVIASIYMLAGKDKLLRQARRLVHALLRRRRAEELLRVGRLSNGVFSGFISGKILDSAIIGLACFAGLSIMSVVGNIFSVRALQMQYTLLISVVVGVTNVIPFFGPFIGAIPSALILLMVNPWSAVWFAVFVLVLQQFDGNILGPKILGDSTGLPAMWVLIAIIVGGGLFGFVGMLLGVPTTAVLYTLGSGFVARRLNAKSKEAQPEPAAAPPEGCAQVSAESGAPAGGEIEGAPFVRHAGRAEPKPRAGDNPDGG